MDNLFLALALVSLVALVVGLIKPTVLKVKSRKQSLLFFGGGGLILFILFGVTYTQPTQNASPAEQPQQKQITYQIVERWTIPNGGEGKVVVISPDLLNETDMVALGSKLKSDTQNDRNAFISVFDDASAAALRDKVLSDKATVEERDLYDKHFVGSYSKNGNTGYHEFVIWFDGVMGTNKKTITY